MFIANLIVAGTEARGRGPYYGIAGYWCWIAPAYSTERYTSEYLFSFASAGFSFILYVLVFLRLRGNITVSGGYKVYFHQRPKLRVGRTSAGTYILADDQRVESHLTTVAKQMLWYPVAYTILVLPIGTSRYYNNSGASVPFPVTIGTAALFMLSGFVNTMLFCATRSVLSRYWRQRPSIGTAWNSRRGDITLSTWGNSAWRRTEPGPRQGTMGAGRSSFVIDISVEKDIEIKYDDGPSPSSFRSSTPTSPACPLRVYSGRQRADDTYSSHIRQPSIPPLGDERSLEVDGADEHSFLNSGAHPARTTNIVDATTLRHPLYISRRRERGTSEPAMGLEVPASVYPFSMAASGNTSTGQIWSPPVVTFGPTVNHAYPSRASGDFGGNGGGTYYNR
jgi:hypothetical protein